MLRTNLVLAGLAALALALPTATAAELKPIVVSYDLTLGFQNTESQHAGQVTYNDGDLDCAGGGSLNGESEYFYHCH